MANNFRRDDESPTEYAERVERANATASRWFNDATKPQLAAYNERMAVAAAYKGAPKWDRFREAAEREFKRTTQAAAELCNLTFAELMTAGEVSEALSYRWDELAIADAIGADATADRWTSHADGKLHVFTAEDGRRFTVVKINDVGGKRNYSARRDGFVNTLIGYSETLAHAKARVEADAIGVAIGAEPALQAAE